MRALLILSALASATPAFAGPLPYRVGVARVDITPDHPIRLNGFGGRRTESEGVYQKLHARALAIEDGTVQPAVLMAVDVLGIPAEVFDEVAKRLAAKANLPKTRLAITATHTHTGPMLTGANPTLFGVPIPNAHLANIDRYTPRFIDKLEEAALAAIKDLKPAKLEWGVGGAKFAANRRTANGPVDHDLPVLFVKDEKGAVRAVYLNYACHCVTLSHNKLGGDWAGYAAASVEDAFAGSVALVAIGCGADQNPKSGVTGGKEDVAAGQGREIAAEVQRLSRNFLAPVTGNLVCKVTELDLPFARHPTRAEWDEKAKRMDAIGHHARVTLAKLDRGEKLPAHLGYPVQTWAFGESLAMVHLPGEVVVDYALRLKKELDGRRVWVTAYANHSPCYIPSERVLKEGGYEGGGAMIYYDQPASFAPGLEEKIVSAVKGHVGKSFAPKFDPAKTGGSLPLSPQQSHATIHVAPNLRVDLVAAEPLVADPVAIAFGPDGKVWVAEMADYPSGKSGKFEPGGRVVFLEDANGDGVSDQSTVFLDNLPFPTGVLPWRGGVLICAAPDILFAEDTNGDGKADVVTKLYSGFGTENYQGRVNSLQYGLDGWVYGSCGLFGGNIKCHKAGRTVPLGDRDFRIKPDTGELEPATGRTQQGRVRDDAGNWFGCDNSTLLRHYALEDHHLRRNPHVTYPNASVTLAGGQRLFSRNSGAQRFALSGPPDSVTAACGLGLYRDDLLGAAFRGNAFTCEPVNLLVTRRVLTPKGSTFEASRAADEQDREFLASTDNWFRPVHAVTGPDGGLWVADMYRFLIEHPRWIPPADLAKIDPRAGAGLGRIYRVRPADKPLRPRPRLDKLDTAGLVAALDSPNGWQRDTAMMMLLWKKDAAARIPLVTLVEKSPNPLARLHALCALGTDAMPELLALALADPDARVRRHALRIAEAVPKHPRQLTAILKAVENPDPHVMKEHAAFLGAWGSDTAGEELARVALRGTDPFVRAVAVSSLRPDNLAAFARALVAQSGKDGPPPALMRDALATAAASDNGVSLPPLLAAVTGSDGPGFKPWQLAAAAGAMDALERRGKVPPEVAASVSPLVAFARATCEKEDSPDVLAALPLLGRDPATRADDVKRLAALLAATLPAAVQSAALAALVRTSDASVPPALVKAWPGASPALRTRILDAFLSRPAWHADLLAAVEKGTVAANQLDAARRQQLASAADKMTRDRAAKVFAGGSNADRQKVIDDYTPALALAADKSRGKAVFAKSCAACHVLDGVGHAVGPDLAALANKSPLYLLSEVFDPSRNLDSRFAEYRATLKDGRVVTGLLAAETATGVTLRGQQAKDETILRGDIETLVGTAKSLMPEGLEKEVSKQDAADLVAYLTAADPPHKKIAGNSPAEVVASDNALTLPAAKAFVYGRDITFETEFGNIGYWHGEADHVAWKVRLVKPAAFDVYLDAACANDSAGNAFALDAGGGTLRGKVAGTGGWDRYTLTKLGTVNLPAGASRITFRPDGTIRGALIDLRTLYLVPVGAKPKTPAAPSDKPLSPAEIAKAILDPATPAARRESLVKEAIPHAAAVVKALTADLPKGDAKEEYRRIPWVWRVSIAAGKANDADVLRATLDVSLPNAGEPLRDWQAVVIGGGVINGLSLEGVWPNPRVAELVRGIPEIEKRWTEAVRLSHASADDEKVPHGTRYDALRIVALDDWAKAEPRLVKYLVKTANAELQQGAVSGLVDVDHPDAAKHLLKALPDLTPENRGFAVGGMLRTVARANSLLDAVENGTCKPEWVGKDHRDALRKHHDVAVRERAGKVFAASEGKPR